MGTLVAAQARDISNIINALHRCGESNKKKVRSKAKFAAGELAPS
jgi:hypothetical protein